MYQCLDTRLLGIMLACELAGFCDGANRCEIEAIIRATNAFTAGFVRVRALHAALQNPPLMRFTGSDVSSVEHVNRGTAIQGKSMRIQYTNQWLPRVSVFPRVSLRAYREQAGHSRR